MSKVFSCFSCIKKTCVSRADLIRLYSLCKEPEIDEIAGLFGFFREKREKARIPDKRITPEIQYEEKAETKVAQPVEPVSDKKRASMHYYCMTGYRKKEPEETVTEVPAWFETAREFKNGEVKEDKTKIPPPAPPLVPWPRLWPFLRSVLGDIRTSRIPDIKVLIKRIAECRPIKRLPGKKRKVWAPSCQIMFDCDERLSLFWNDEALLYNGIKRLRGKAGLDALVLENGPAGPVRKWGRWKESPCPYRLPAPGTPLLVVSDCGLLAFTGEARKTWIDFGRQLAKAGFFPVALTPSPPRLWDSGFVQYWHPVSWDRGRKLSLKTGPAYGLSSRGEGRADTAGTGALLTLVSPAVRVEPALLRSIRLLLPCKVADVGTEAFVWNHECTDTCYLGFVLKKQDRERYRKMFGQADKVLQEKVFSLIMKYHQHLSPAVVEVEKMIYEDITGREPDTSQTFLRNFIKTVHYSSRFINLEGLKAWYKRMASMQSGTAWQGNDDLAASWVMVHREELLKQEMTDLPPGIDTNRYNWILSGVSRREDYRVNRAGDTLFIEKQAEKPGNGIFPVAGFTVQGPVLQIKATGTGITRDYTLRIQAGKNREIDIAGTPALLLNTELAELEIKPITLPEWAYGMGKDRYGLFMDSTVKDVLFRMRWINPGEFLMGSPVDEPKRSDGEIQHRVILTKGFWMAETACTQELWQAVMGNNPSSFKGENLPVEWVSWDDCKDFIENINTIVPGLQLRLPTEAEWEYACRAGTTTPFSFGKNITTDQVNYNGNYPYPGGKKGKHRGKTVPVKTFSCNAWGLYEMHGNVWEWCADRYGEYTSESVTDPLGPEIGRLRVLRGGSWGIGARFVRSASRFWYVPGSRDGFIGFRPARGQK